MHSLSWVPTVTHSAWASNQLNLVPTWCRDYARPSKFHFRWQKKWLVAARNLQSIKTSLTLELSQYSKSGSMFFSSEPTATTADSETPCACARPSNLHKQSRTAAPSAWPLILPSKPLITFWNRLWRDCQMTGRGSILYSNLNSATWPASCKGFIASEITALTVWSSNSFKFVTDAKFEPGEVTFLRLMPRLPNISWICCLICSKLVSVYLELFYELCSCYAISIHIYESMHPNGMHTEQCQACTYQYHRLGRSIGWKETQITQAHSKLHADKAEQVGQLKQA